MRSVLRNRRIYNSIKRRTLSSTGIDPIVHVDHVDHVPPIIVSAEPQKAVVGKGGISAKIIADSHYHDRRITTFELEYMRFIHPEFMTHRLLSKNSESSRAVPVSSMIKSIQNNVASPVHWGKNKRGMQAVEENDTMVSIPWSLSPTSHLDHTLQMGPEQAWRDACLSAISYANAFSDAGYHKQIVNRLLEPFKMMKIVCTATEFDNFFWLRRHADAQPEIKELADVMYRAREMSQPTFMPSNSYHLPYVTSDVKRQCDMTDNPMSAALKVSASCCAQVSYRKTDQSLSKAARIYQMLVESVPMHASPFEHQARPATPGDMHGFYDTGDSSPITHVSRDCSYWSGNLRWWVQYRHEIEDNTCWHYTDVE